MTIFGANDGVAGDGTRGAETIIDGQVVIAADGVTIDGVSVVGSGSGAIGTTGIVVSTGSDGFSLVNSVLDGTADVAVFVGGVTGLDVGHNLIEGYSIGMYIATGGTSGSVHDNLFQGDDAGFGVGLGNGVNSETSHVTITGNTFDAIYAGSLNLFPFGPDPVDINTYVFDNFITNTDVERPVQIYPTVSSTHITGTDESEAFNGDPTFNPAVNGLSLGFDGRGGDDHAFGNSAADDFHGGDGSDQLFGGGGDDVLSGDAGDDLLDGEAGIDTAVFADNSVGYTSTVIGWLINSSEGNDFLQRTEIVEDGTGQRNLLVGGTAFGGIQAALDAAVAGDNVRLATGNYSGTFNYDVAGLTVIAQPGAVQNLTYTPAGTEGITVIAGNGADTITTGAGDDVLYGNGGIDHLNGGGGNDALDGGAGADVMTGGTGSDTFYVDDAVDETLEAVGGGSRDVVYAALSYNLAAGQEIEVLSAANQAGTAALVLVGNELNQEIYGNAGANYLQGGGGTDYLIGLGGNDTYFVTGSGEIVVENAGEGTRDVIYTVGNYTMAAGVDVEVLSAQNQAGTGALSLVGNALSQEIYGNAGANYLEGGGGADVLIGLGGDDIYLVDSDEYVSESAGGGRDVVYATASYALVGNEEVEVLSTISQAATTAIDLTGNNLANELYGNAGDNVLNGGGGADYLMGFGGADTFAFTTALGGGNIDTVADFVAGTDKIALDDAVFTEIGGLGALNANAFVTGSAAARCGRPDHLRQRHRSAVLRCRRQWRWRRGAVRDAQPGPDAHRQ